MRRTIDYPRFVRALQELDVEVPTRALLQAPVEFWQSLDVEVQDALLASVGLVSPEPNNLLVQVGRRPDAPKTEDNLLVVFSGEGGLLEEREPPEGETPAGTEEAETDVEVATEAEADDDEDLEDDEDDDRPMVEIQPPEDPNLEVVEIYEVNPPYAFVRILYDEEEHEYWYEVLEPHLVERERNVLVFIEDTLIDVMEVGLSALTEREAEDLLREQVDQIIYDYSITLSRRSKRKLLYYILRDFLGFAKLDVLMNDEQIEDVSCDGPEIPVFLYHRTYESLKSTVQWPNHEELDSYVIRLAQRSGKHISIAEPLLDATLPDGSRLNATLGDEVTSKGSTFTIRKFREDPFTPPDLVRFGTMSVEMLAYWWMAVQHGASAIYAGGTASGKTTSLNAILLFIPPQMKIVSIEDTREVNLPHLNWIPAFTRSGFGPRDAQGRQAGEIDMFTLLKAALRQRPEYILVGEVRGEEAYALFQAMATGHTAYGTMHADSVSSVIHRLESDPISVPRSLLEALDVVSIQIQTRIGDKRVRRTRQLVEIVGLDPHTREILTNDVFEWNPTTDTFEFSGVSYVLERIQMERNMTDAEMREEMDRRKEVIRWMIDEDLRDLHEVGKVIQSYYKDPEVVLARARGELEDDDVPDAAPAAAGSPGGPGPGAPAPPGTAGPASGSGGPPPGATASPPDGQDGASFHPATDLGDLNLRRALDLSPEAAENLRHAGYPDLAALLDAAPGELDLVEGARGDLTSLARDLVDGHGRNGAGEGA